MLELLDLELDVPDYSTISRRTRGLDVALDPASLGGPLELATDATGLAIFGEGEWAAARWGGRGRRGWKKLHVAVDAYGQIQAADLTDSSTSDAAAAPGLLDQVDGPVSEVVADGAYDQRPVYQAIHDKDARSVIPPSRNAKISGKLDHRERDANLERIEKVGRRQWRKEAGSHRQARAENTFYRLKSTFGGRLRARHPRAQRAEALTLCKLLNRMMELGGPTSVRISA